MIFLESFTKEAESISKKRSSISGHGLFPRTSVKKGTYVGLAFSKVSETGIPDKDYRSTVIGRMVNHSDIPNLEIVQRNRGKTIGFVANKDISAGQEFTVNYMDFPWEGKRDFAKK